MSEFKKRLLELRAGKVPLFRAESIAIGAEGLHEAMQTCKILLQEINPGPVSNEDLLTLLPMLLRYETEADLVLLKRADTEAKTEAAKKPKTFLGGN